ncbi:MAG: PDZ domain-containing protein, partial [Clostridia bacterium]|nr:PDZ domain-containing protein [Clostridia bacterium]
MKEWKKRTWMLGTAAALALTLGSPQVQAIGELPDKVSLTAGSNTILSFALPVSARLESGDTQATLTKMEDGVEISAGGETGTAKLFLRLLGLVPVKQVDVEVSDELRLIPGGKSVGIAIETEGLVVVGASDLGNSASPARRAGLKPGDIITQVNGQDVRTAEEFAAQLHPGETEVLTVRRGEETIELQLVPGRDPRDGSTR